MGPEHALRQEFERDADQGDSRIPEVEPYSKDHREVLCQIEYKPIDREKEIGPVAALVWAFWRRVNGEDLSDRKTFQVISGGIPTEVTVPRSESVLYAYFAEGCRVQCAWRGTHLVGILVYQPIFDCMIGVRALYLQENERRTGVGMGLVKSLTGVKRIFFQTRTSDPPLRMLEVSRGRRRKVSETGDLVTWEMDWEENHGV